MGIFSYLLVGHLVGDYLLQTNWMAVNKRTNWLALIVHSAVYTICITLALFIGSRDFPIAAILLVFVSHIFLDRHRFVAWWAKSIMSVDEKKAGWLLIMVDQTFHILLLAVVGHIWFT